jgi:hypothetical protein
MMWPGNAVQAGVNIALNRVEVADAAAQLHGDVLAYGFEDAFDGG